MLNEHILSYSQHSLLYNRTMEVDTQLVDKGVKVTDNDITVIMDGTFHSAFEDIGRVSYSQIDQVHDYGTPLPLKETKRGAAQMLISDYALKSLLTTSLELYCHNLSKKMDG